jgi:DNA-directed RNA polymerase subunit M/transcription elongation factor TFIIS
MSAKRYCPECNEVLVGRQDKKFCSDACRNSFNNKQNSDTTNYVRNVNNSLRRNRRILKEHLSGDTSKVTKKKLSDVGFNFSFYTNIAVTKTNNTYYYCYEYGYLYLENDWVLVVRKNKENKS